MDIHFLEREFKNGEIEWGIVPLYLMAIREKNLTVWNSFVKMINAIDDHTLDEALEERRKHDKLKNV